MTDTKTNLPRWTKSIVRARSETTTHSPKILWDGEEDAADYFTLISLLHRRLDRCFRTSPRH
jgi:hypothetical protein